MTAFNTNYLFEKPCLQRQSPFGLGLTRKNFEEIQSSGNRKNKEAHSLKCDFSQLEKGSQIVACIKITGMLIRTHSWVPPIDLMVLEWVWEFAFTVSSRVCWCYWSADLALRSLRWLYLSFELGEVGEEYPWEFLEWEWEIDCSVK